VGVAATAAVRVTVADTIPRLATEVVGILLRVTVAEVIPLRVTVAEAGVIQPPAVAGHRMAEDRRIVEDRPRTAVAAVVGLTVDMGGRRER
jgi:hypothetical protein